jgi:hypothetical protein
MLAQLAAESCRKPITKVPFANWNGKPDKSNGSDTQVAKIKKELTYAQREIAILKIQLHQAKENMAQERVERSSILRKCLKKIK